jgi:hypothetical protein
MGLPVVVALAVSAVLASLEVLVASAALEG